MKLRRWLCLSLLVTLTSCHRSGVPQSVSASSFYANHSYALIDSNNDLDNILLLIYEPWCSHCEVAEPILFELYYEDYKEYNFVTITATQLRSGYYDIGLSYEECIDFYYDQDAEYGHSNFDKEELKNLGKFPTPTMMYLKETKSISHIVIGIGSSKESIKQKIELLIKE